MAEDPKKKVSKPKPEPKPEPKLVLIDIVCGKRRRQCHKDDFPAFKARGFTLAENKPNESDPKSPSATADK